MKKCLILSLLFFSALSLAVAAEIKGKVVGLDGKPIAGALVLEPASGAKSESDDQGKFTLSVPEAKSVRLVIVHPDYFEEEVRLSARQLSAEVTVTLVPLIRQRQEVLVTATRFPEPSAQVPAAGTVMLGETLVEKMPANITDALNNLPGVVSLGSGGFSLVPSIRGMSRRRVLLMIDSARLVSDRRTGPSASFLSPEDIDRIEVLRSPNSVFYGSDALGGVINMFTTGPEVQKGIRGRFHGRYGTNQEEKGLGLSLQAGTGRLGFLLSAQGVDAENYSSPKAEVLQSQYTQKSLQGKLVYRSEKRDIEMSFLGARGTNIGKPNRTSASKPTWYPKENQNLAQLLWNERGIGGNGDLTVHFYINPNFLETRTDTKEAAGYVSKVSLSKTESTEMGWQISFRKEIVQSFRVTAGSDFFGRSGVQANNQDTSYNSLGMVTKIFKETPYNSGRRNDFGFFLSGDYYGLPNLDLTGGVRLDVLRQKANPGGKSEDQENNTSALTGFLAGSWRISEDLTVFVNAGRAYRAPELSERFYSGITGRGYIISKPDLKPETSFNLDAGVKFIRKRVFVGLYGFSYKIENMIDRVKVVGTASTYAYQNVDKGVIKGVETEFEVFPVNALSIFGNAAVLKGKSDTNDAPLNDIPSARLYVGARSWLGRFVFEVNGTFIAKKDNPGPAEIAIPAAECLNFKATYNLGNNIRFYAVFNNALNKTYYGRPDPEAMEEPGRNFVFGFSCGF
jgi:outer membrane receptor protein involved in Fe transport